jgi:hypothetical protein
MKQVNLFFIFALSCLLIPVTANAEKLGSIKLYKSHSGSPEIEMTLMRLGDNKERRILAYFKTPDFAINGEYNIYQGRCETTRCNKIIYKVIGGSIRNIVSNSGYFGDYFELLLSGRNKPLSVYYDKKSSSKLFDFTKPKLCIN